MDGLAGEVTGLLIQTHEVFQLRIGDEVAGSQAGLQLADQNVLLEALAELHAAHALLLQDLIETCRIELAVDLEGRGLQDQLVQRGVGEAHAGFLGALQQQRAVDQRIERGLAQQLVVQQRGVEILAELLNQLTALHIHGSVEAALRNLLTVDVSRILAVAGGLDDGIEAGKGHQHDDHANNGFGDPALGVVPDVLQHASPETPALNKQPCSVGIEVRIKERRIRGCAFS